MSTKTYSARAQSHPTAIGRRLLSIMATKQTNLCLSIDLTDPDQVLAVIEKLAPKICLVKTHIDILRFSPPSANTITSFTSALTRLSTVHNFLIFEDRKFADIGNTVQHQYSAGIYSIVTWAHIINAHSLPGEGIIHGLSASASSHVSSGGEPRALLLLQEMSSKGNLFSCPGYKEQTLDMARRNNKFVMGFISMGSVRGESTSDEDDFITMTPGVNIEKEGDPLGQQYKTPEHVIGDRGSDIIIVGRGIYGSQDMLGMAEVYRARAWEAYLKRVEGAENSAED